MNVEERIHKFKKYGSEANLNRISKLLSLLGNPERDLKFIHVAGTNGKGSVCMYIYEILLKEGYRVGLFTSPSLEIFNERIQVDGRMISDEELQNLSEEVFLKASYMEEIGFETPTEFEIITAISFLYFKKKNVEFVVLEVGLGGRFDATNVIEKSIVSVITSISFDHTAILGNSISEIAMEKAGIIKKGCPIVSSVRSEDAFNVIKDRAYDLDTSFYSTRNISFITKYETVNGSKFDVTIKDKFFKDLQISMVGKHQIENAICAVAAILTMVERGINISDESIYYGLRKAKQIGRYEVLSKEPLVIIDGAHNPDGAKSLKDATQTILRGKKILVVIGMLKDKDITNSIKEIAKISKDFIVTAVPNLRTEDPNELANEIENLGRNTYVVQKPKEAISVAMEMGRSFDATIYCGSLYLIGYLRSIIKEEINAEI